MKKAVFGYPGTVLFFISAEARPGYAGRPYGALRPPHPVKFLNNKKAEDKHMADVFEKYTWEMKNDINEISEKLLSQKCIVTTYFHQYAAGVCGANRAVHAYLKADGTGWPYDAAAYKAAKDAGIKNRTRRGCNEGYGEVGFMEFKRTVMSVRDVIMHMGDITRFEPLKEIV